MIDLFVGTPRWHLYQTERNCFSVMVTDSCASVEDVLFAVAKQVGAENIVSAWFVDQRCVCTSKSTFSASNKVFQMSRHLLRMTQLKRSFHVLESSLVQ